MPSGKTCNDLKAYIKEYQIKKGQKPDIICVDYLDLMMPASAKVDLSDVFTKDKLVSEELRNLANELNAVLLSASQLGRSSVDETEFDHSHISGGISKIFTADNVFGIFTSAAMRQRGEYQIQLMKTRNSSGVGKKIMLDFDIEALRITDSGEKDGNTAKPSIVSTLKPYSNVLPTAQKNTMQGAQLKNMLAGLKTNNPYFMKTLLVSNTSSIMSLQSYEIYVYTDEFFFILPYV
jgi:hypothetical protein